ncbi:MAG TPA: AbrB family transcriptional regulator [Paenibacillaceae bacterium]|mgnify:FL=1|nr:AbrB family transcriptional regulator [Paenibacillaceae bacterium]
MRATGIVRPLDQLGRVVLPKKLRTNLNINVDDPLEIFVQGETIIVAKYYPKCTFCQSKENVVPFKNRHVCQECLNNLK